MSSTLHILCIHAHIPRHNTSPPIPRPAEPTVSGPENDPNLPGDADIDGSLRHEYVMVGDSKALEFNRTVEGKSRHHHSVQCS